MNKPPLAYWSLPHGEAFCAGCDGSGKLSCSVAKGEKMFERACEVFSEEAGYSLCGQLKMKCPKHPGEYQYHAKGSD